MSDESKDLRWELSDSLALGALFCLCFNLTIGMLAAFVSFAGRLSRPSYRKGDGSIHRFMTAGFMTLIAGATIYVQNSYLLEEMKDPAAPGPIQNAQGEATPRSLKLTWLSSGDDGDKGVARQGLALAESAQSVKKHWSGGFVSGVARFTISDSAGGTPNSFEFELSPSAQEREYFFYAWARDDKDKLSPLSETSIKVPASEGVLFEENGSGEGWTLEGKWERSGPIDTGTDILGECWSYMFYEPGVNHSITSTLIALPAEQPAELLVRIYCKLAYDDGDRVYLEVWENGKDWVELASFNSSKGKQGFQRYSLEPWKGKRIKIRFRLDADEKSNDRGFAFDDLCIFLSAEAEKEPKSQESNKAPK